jgi:hypothetical protein
MDLLLATLKAFSFYLVHNVSTLDQCRKFYCVTVVCKHFAGYQDYPNYKWDLFGSLRITKVCYMDFPLFFKMRHVKSVLFKAPTYF